MTWDSLFSDTPISSRSCAAVPCSRSAFRWLEPPSGASSRRKGPGPGATTGLTRLVAKIPLQKEYVCVRLTSAASASSHHHHHPIFKDVNPPSSWKERADKSNSYIYIYIYIQYIYIYNIYAHTYIHTLHYITYIQYIHTLHYITYIQYIHTLHYIHTIYTYINNLYYRSISFSLLCPVDYW